MAIHSGAIEEGDDGFPPTIPLDQEWQEDLQFFGERDYKIQVALRRHNGQPPPPSIAFLLKEED